MSIKHTTLCPHGFSDINGTIPPSQGCRLQSVIALGKDMIVLSQCTISSKYAWQGWYLDDTIPYIKSAGKFWIDEAQALFSR